MVQEPHVADRHPGAAADAKGGVKRLGVWASRLRRRLEYSDKLCTDASGRYSPPPIANLKAASTLALDDDVAVSLTQFDLSNVTARCVNLLGLARGLTSREFCPGIRKEVRETQKHSERIVSFRL